MLKYVAITLSECKYQSCINPAKCKSKTMQFPPGLEYYFCVIIKILIYWEILTKTCYLIIIQFSKTK